MRKPDTLPSQLGAPDRPSKVHYAGGWVRKRAIALLFAAGHVAYAPTLTGCGNRTHLLTCNVDPKAHIQDVVKVLEYEDLRDVIFVGHSYGGVFVTVVADRALSYSQAESRFKAESMPCSR